MKHLLKLFVLLSFLFLTTQASAQRDYNTSIGLRLGYTSGLTVKGFVSDRIALEGILSTRFWGAWGWRANNVMLTGLFEYQFPINGVAGLNWFVGGGLHVGFYGGYYPANNGWGNNRGYYVEGGTYVGLDAIIGLEYTLASAPFTFQLDLKPTIHVFGPNWGYGDLALSARYTF